MRGAALFFLCGVLGLHTLAVLPDRRWALALALLLPALYYWPKWRYPLWALGGFLWALLLTPTLITLPADLHGAEVSLEGQIASIPTRHQRQLSFMFQVDAAAPLLAGKRLRLAWWDDATNTVPAPQVGERWRFTLRLKQIWGMRNPGAFDSERWHYAKGIFAKASVRSTPAPQRLTAANGYWLDTYRQRVVDSFNAHLPGNAFVGILTALAVGVDSAISPWQWEIFRRTGITHLVSISGSHISLVAGMLFACMWTLWSRIPSLALRWPSSSAAAVSALIGAGVYTLLSGLSVPAQRSFLMAAVALLVLLLQRPLVPSRLFAIALFVVLILDPNAPLTVGFWLSFYAVAVILFSTSGHQHSNIVSATLHTQLRIGLALLPLTLLFFQQFPPLSLLANLVAIPWVGITVLPLSLLAALCTPLPAIQALLLHWALLSIEGLWKLLLWMSSWPGMEVWYRPQPALWALALALVGIVIWLAPRGLPGRWLGIPLCLPLLFPPMQQPAAGGFWFTMLDVGEGLSAVVRTANHVLVYDSGGKIGATLDGGAAALVPFLHYQQVDKVDLVIISHADFQHSGGLRSLREALPVSAFTTSAAAQLALDVDEAQSCAAGQTWEWDGVRFAILHPPASGFRGDNASCVLKVESAAGRVLLPGDIEGAAERALLNKYGSGLAAEVLVAPHQGRRNFSSPAFLQAVNPRYVLFATGYRNRYGYPRPETLATYQANGASVLDSSYQGALTLRVEAGRALAVERYRPMQRRYWHSVAAEPEP